jgi:cell division protein FtsI (penicillin-binding protein 3)
VRGYEIGGKTGTANKTINGTYSKKYINTFASIFPISNPKFVFVVLMEETQINKDYIYEYRDGSRFKLKGTPRNTAGWTSVEVAGKIIEKIGPILATKYIQN